MSRKIVILACKDISTNMVYNFIARQFAADITVFLEEREGLKVYLKRRIKRIGLLKVIGQLLFQGIIAKMLHVFSKKRIESIISQYNLDRKDIPRDRILHFNSVNSAESIEALQRISPDLIIVNGTRIISKKVLKSIPCKFINMHAGITPKYRGVHGAYWALVNNDKEHCGVTVHYVDEGIDTGNIIAQSVISVTKKDNFSTYPYIQIGEGIQLFKKVIADHFENAIMVQQNTLESILWYHPTIWGYISNLFFKKVK